MTDCIDLENGMLWGGASWMVSGILRDIARAMASEALDSAFSNWLLDVSDRPNGLASFDMRGLTSDQRNTFFKAAKIALEMKKTAGSEKWEKPEVYEAYIEYFSLLVESKPAPHYVGKTEWDGLKIDFNDLWQTK